MTRERRFRTGGNQHAFSHGKSLTVCRTFARDAGHKLVAGKMEGFGSKHLVAANTEAVICHKGGYGGMGERVGDSRTFRAGLGEGIVHAADSLFKLQRTFVTLGVYSVIIKKAIGDIRCLLNFVNDASLFQRVNHTGRQVDEVPFLHGPGTA